MTSPTEYRGRSTAAFALVSLTSIRGVLFGIAFTLYCMCAQLWYKDCRNNHGRRKRNLFLFGYSSLIMVFTMISFATDTHLVVSAFLDRHGSLHVASMHHIQLPTDSPNLEILHGMSPPIIITMISVLQVWRVWIIWSTTRYRIAATLGPVLIFLVSLTICIVNDYFASAHLAYNPRAHATAVRLGIASAALLTGFNIFVSLLVMGRLMFIRRRVSQLVLSTPDQSRFDYTNVSAMLVESYALVAVCYLADTITRAFGDIGSRAGILIWAIEVLVEVIAYFLVLYRVLQGRAWSEETEHHISTVRCNQEDDKGDSLTGL